MPGYMVTHGGQHVILMLLFTTCLAVDIIERSQEGGTVHCPDTTTCELICRGPRACKNLRGGSGSFSQITCDSAEGGRGEGACAGATLPTGTGTELTCKGAYACQELNGGNSSGHFSKITCDSTGGGAPGSKLESHDDSTKSLACLLATLPQVPDGLETELSCLGDSACRYLRGGLGHYTSIICIGNGACSYLALPTIPEGKTSQLQCQGSKACASLKGGIGNYQNISCNGYQACWSATMPTLPDGHGFELLCRGQEACYKLHGGKGGFSRISCDESRICTDEEIPANEWDLLRLGGGYHFSYLYHEGDDAEQLESRPQFYVQRLGHSIEHYGTGTVSEEGVPIVINGDSLAWDSDPY